MNDKKYIKISPATINIDNNNDDDREDKSEFLDDNCGCGEDESKSGFDDEDEETEEILDLLNTIDLECFKLKEE